MLKHTLDSALEEFGKIGMSIDPDKSELMHFSWKQNAPSPPLTFTHGHQTITLTPPKHLDGWASILTGSCPSHNTSR